MRTRLTREGAFAERAARADRGGLGAPALPEARRQIDDNARMVWRRLVLAWLLLTMAATSAPSQDLTRGAVIDTVTTAADATQTYALYLPSGYTRDRTWPVLVGFHPGGRGRAIVDAYREAAERHGVIVAGSHNARNGPWDASLHAAIALVQDLAQRVAIDGRRLYLTGHSGGARLALHLANANPQIAGVIASSAGFPGGQAPRSARFAIFATAGSDDFNYLEMRALDRALTTPHRLVVFAGGHTLPPPDVADAALAWLDLHAMANGLRPRDEAFIASQWEARMQAAVAAGESAAAVHLLRALAEDFRSLRDVTQVASQAKALSTRADIARALERERDEDAREARMVEDLVRLRADASAARGGDRRAWRARVEELEAAAADDRDPAARARARRLLQAATMMERDR